jgi:alkylated DNA nucleotide flippase Atl1
MIDKDTAEVAALARTIGLALAAFAEAIQPQVDEDAHDLNRLGLGKRQQEIAEVPGLHGDAGLASSEIAAEIGYDPANTHTALKALQERGIVEDVGRPGERTRWRLAPEYRGASNPYLRMGALIEVGEWTTYDDISLAVHGDRSRARAVRRAAESYPAFPCHRVLAPGGRVPPTWRAHASASADPDECVRLLTDESVVVHDRRASRAQYVSWDALIERGEATPFFGC